MTVQLYVNDLEIAWLTTCIVGLALSSAGLADAIADHRAVKALNGRAREIVSTGNVRREAVRVGLQIYMLVLVIPSLFDDRSVTITLAGIMFILGLPVGLAVNSLLDVRERRRLSDILATQIELERGNPPRRRSGD